MKALKMLRIYRDLRVKLKLSHSDSMNVLREQIRPRL